MDSGNSVKDKNKLKDSTKNKLVNKEADGFSRGGAVEKATKKASGQGKRGLSLSFKRSNFWNSLHNKTLELPERLRREERKLVRVPRLQIWLSTDQSTKDPPPEEHQVLNNTREPLPKLHLDQPRAIYRSASEGAKWKIVIDGSSPPPPRDGAAGGCYDPRNERPKSPVEKQPTWPITYPHHLHARPRLTHQDNIQQQLHQHQQQQQQQKQLQKSVESERRRGELPRQDAVADETDARETDPLKAEDPAKDAHDSICSVEPAPAHTPARVPRPRLLKAPNCLGVGNLWPRRFSMSSRSCSDDKSDVSEVGGALATTRKQFSRSDSIQSEQGAPEIVTLSVNSMCSFTESGSAVSPGSSHLSLRSELSRTHSLSQPHPRSNSNTVERAPSFRLQIPGHDSQRSRRPSLLSLRSLARSLNPYFSMDYDYDSFDYDPAQLGPGTLHHMPYLPEPVPKLSFTQKLAFPTLVQNSIDRPKPRDPYMEAEHNMNTFAKIITIVVLALVTVLVLGVLYKLLH
ncbi:uncharacterized protein [Panulirus ornatus]|uniref:uncharacterized protein isoform X2 n=1 Tax=Panulirus ornatus TaxID=150431 RepID=UPI003A8A7239